MVNSPLYTILVVGNNGTGKTSLISRNMGISHENWNLTHNSELVYYYIQVPNTVDCVRVIEIKPMSTIHPSIPDEYVNDIKKIVIVASFDSEYSIYDISYYMNLYSNMNAAFHAVINKKDISSGLNIMLDTRGCESIHTVSCKYDTNYVNLVHL